METIDDLVMASILKTRPVNPTELWERYEKTCKANNTMPLYGQFALAVKRVLKAGSAKVIMHGNEKRIILA